MTYDEEAADRATAELASLTDERQIADIRTGLAAALSGWRLWRGGPDYPPRGHAHRSLADSLERTVGDLETALRTLPDDADLRTVANLAGPLLGAYVPDRAPGAGPFSDAVELLRWLAITRPSLVAEARRLSDTG